MEELILKDGRKVILRAPEPGDAEAMLQYMKQTAGESVFLVRYPEEVNNSIEKEAEFLKNELESDNSFWMTAFDGKRVIGNIQVSIYKNHIKTKHRAGMGIAIVEEYCSAGLGTVLMNRGIAWAREHGFLQLELRVFSDNKRAISLYEKIGFVRTGTTPNAYRLKDGSFCDEDEMVLIL